MKSEESAAHDHLVDMLLCELVGGETPPDLRGRVLGAVDRLPKDAPARRKVARNPIRSRRPRPSVLPGFLSAAAVVALLITAGGLFYGKYVSESRTPALSSISGKVNRSVGPVAPGESLITGADSSAVIAYEDGTIVELDSETTVVVSKQAPWERSKQLEIISGKVTATVSPQREGSPMSLVSKDASAVVVGTKLLFQCQGGISRLEVTEGAVRFVPRSGEAPVLVKSGLFAEAGKTGFRTGEIRKPPVRGITGFTLMNAETDQPIRSEVLVSGEALSLASLPTRDINIRADFEGAPPNSVKIIVSRADGDPTGLPPHLSQEQKYPPFFVAGDHWAEGRPDDCRAWTPQVGLYHLFATAVYSEGGANFRKDLKIDLLIVD